VPSCTCELSHSPLAEHLRARYYSVDLLYLFDFAENNASVLYVCMIIYLSKIYTCDKCTYLYWTRFYKWRTLMGDPLVFNVLSDVGDPIVGYGCYQSTHVRDAMAFPRAGL